MSDAPGHHPEHPRPSEAGRGGPQQIPRPSSARPGPPAPWPPRERITLAEVVAAVGAGEPDSQPDATLAESVDGHPVDGAAGSAEAPALPGDGTEELTRYAGREQASAVLCVLFEEGDQAHVVLTRRSSRLRSHTGEVSFPGGRLEAGESAVEAAMREAFEEVGLEPATVTPVGRLSLLSTAVNPAPITPIVATVAARPSLTANPDEVDRVFTVPLAELLIPGVHHSELWSWSDGTERTIHFFNLIGDTLWGATARMLAELLDWLTAADRSPSLH